MVPLSLLFLPKNNGIHSISRRSSSLFAARRLLFLSSAAAAFCSTSCCSAFAQMSSSTPSSLYIDKLALVLVKDRRQLVVRSKGKSVFFTPGGKREVGETDIEALCRECKEELTINLHTNTIRPYGTFQAQAFGKPPGTMVRMTCFTADSFSGVLQPSNEIQELKWITSDCPHSILSVTGIMILQDLKERGLVD